MLRRNVFSQGGMSDGKGADSKHEHSEFFIDDEMAVFLVEDCYYKVHRYFLRRDSEVFRDMFMCPPGSSEAEGKTKENPILLPGVTKFEMSSLMRFFYYGMYDNYYSYKISPAEWTALLSISTRFMFEKIRSRAISVLTPSPYSVNLLDPVDMVALAIKHDIPQWLETAYVLLTMREQPLDETEGEKLGVSICIRLARARERFWREQASMPEGRLEEDIRLGAGSRAGVRASFSSTWGVRANCPKRTRATQIVHEVFWPAGGPVDRVGSPAP